MPKKSTDAAGRIGVNAVERVFLNDLGWVFREQPTSDFGIDAHVEVVHGEPTGRLIALQIKSGLSYLKEKTATGFVYRGDARHLEYWERHSLPVVIVLHDPGTGNCYWETVTKDNVTRMRKHWKLEVPFKNILGSQSVTRLVSIAEGSDYLKRLRQLVLAKPWMELINPNVRLFLEAEEWINKSSGRGSLTLILQDENGDERTVSEWPFVMFPGWPYDEVFPYIFPWADITIDEDFYDSYDHNQHDLEHGSWDSEDGRYIFHAISFGEYRARLPEIRPYEVSGGEVASFRLELTLNEVGRSFLTLDSYLSEGIQSESQSGIPDRGYNLGLKNMMRRHKDEHPVSPLENDDESIEMS